MFDFTGVPYVGTFPGMHSSIGAYLSAVRSYYEGTGHCGVNISAATGPRDQGFQSSILVAETYDFDITMGNEEVPCNAQQIAWPDLRRMRPVACAAPYQSATVGGSPICACPQNSACAFGPPPPCCDPGKGNPVVIVNAMKREVQTDYQSASGLTFKRTYNSLFKVYEDPNNQIGRRLSANWTATYFQRIQYADTGATAGAW